MVSFFIENQHVTAAFIRYELTTTCVRLNEYALHNSTRRNQQPNNRKLCKLQNKTSFMYLVTSNTSIVTESFQNSAGHAEFLLLHFSAQKKH